MDVIQKIIQLRKKKGLTQQHMADKLGIALYNYGKLERGITNITLQRLDEIAEVLEVTVADFFISTPKKNDNMLRSIIDSEAIGFKSPTDNKLDKDVGLQISSIQIVELKEDISTLFLEIARELLCDKDRLIETIEPEILYKTFAKAYIDGYKIEGIVFEWFTIWAKENLHLDPKNPNQPVYKIGPQDLKNIEMEPVYRQWTDWFYKCMYLEAFQIPYIEKFMRRNSMLIQGLDINLYQIWEEYWAKK
ncbi:hypothetical protein ES708_14302 [subsurface metagenome]